MKFDIRSLTSHGVLLVMLMHASTCAQAAEPETVGPPILDVPVFYATNREKMTSNQEEAGARLATFSVGCGRVFLPFEKRWQSGDNQLSELHQKLGWKIDPSRSTFRPFIEVRGYVAEPEPQKVIHGVSQCNDFWERLKSQVESSKDHRVYVYIHGFGSSGDNAVYSAGILAAELEAPVVAFTWPSKGKVGLKRFRLFGENRMRALYLADREMIDRPQVLLDLTNFLAKLKSALGPNVKVNLVAHSLGNRLMARYIASDAADDFAAVYFLAADVDQDLFMQAFKKLPAKSKYTAIYMNKKDRVLKVSAGNDLLGLKFTRKLGDADFSVPGVELIDYDNIAEPRSFEYLNLRHYVPFQHFGSIVRTDIPSVSKNGERFYLIRRTKIEKAKAK